MFVPVTKYDVTFATKGEVSNPSSLVATPLASWNASSSYSWSEVPIPHEVHPT